MHVRIKRPNRGRRRAFNSRAKLECEICSLLCDHFITPSSAQVLDVGCVCGVFSCILYIAEMAPRGAVS